ncbi:hypothetical protein LB503_013383 [Fusarium chuoi]|nr:hypothetical protein LB503_013383 [Fusarium chuoi]
MAATYSVTLLTSIRMQAGWQIRYTRVVRQYYLALLYIKLRPFRLALLIRIAKYLSRKLSLLKGTLAKKIYTWRLLAVMANVFSASIYVFISRSLFIYYNKIYLTDSTKKEDKFYTIVLTITDKIPNLLGICQALYIYVV